MKKVSKMKKVSRWVTGSVMGLAALAAEAATPFAPNPTLRGVWASQKSEIVMTDSVLMYFSREDSARTGIAVLKVPSRGVDVAVRFSTDTILIDRHAPLEVAKRGDALIVNKETFKKVEAIETVAPYDMPTAENRDQIGARLQEWQLGTYMENGGDEVFVTIGTNRNSFLFGIYKGMVYLRAAALLQCNEGSLFVQNIRMMKNPHTGERSNKAFENHLEFLTHLQDIDRTKFRPDCCFFGEQGEIYWSYIDHTPDVIRINGCGDTYTIKRPAKDKANMMEWFRYEP